VFYILGLLVVGLFAGALARLIVGAPQPLGCLGTAVLGVIGAYAGGSLYSIMFYNRFDLRRASTFIGAVIGSIVVLAIWRAIDGRRSHARRR
jgi:uncharacterized membrane protein YeaQ/YmgE (transglycosylase-associated protein family)